MSNISNDRIAELVSEYSERYTGTLVEKLLLDAYKSNDLEKCLEIIKQADEEVDDRPYIDFQETMRNEILVKLDNLLADYEIKPKAKL